MYSSLANPPGLAFLTFNYITINIILIINIYILRVWNKIVPKLVSVISSWNVSLWGGLQCDSCHDKVYRQQHALTVYRHRHYTDTSILLRCVTPPACSYHAPIACRFLLNHACVASVNYRQWRTIHVQRIGTRI